MNPSSAIALVSAMPGADTPMATSFFPACVTESSFLPHAATSVIATMRRTAKLRNFERALLMFALLREWKVKRGRRKSQRQEKNRRSYSLGRGTEYPFRAENLPEGTFRLAGATLFAPWSLAAS